MFSGHIQYPVLCWTPDMCRQAPVGRIRGEAAWMAPGAPRAEDPEFEEGLGAVLAGVSSPHIQASIAPGRR